MPAEELHPTMSDPHATDTPGHAALDDGDHHSATDHGDDHGHDDHAHSESPLGRVDVAAWGAGITGVAIAIVIAACFALATSGLG
jgi:hypothetical protein